jgi:hypothetical protein
VVDRQGGQGQGARTCGDNNPVAHDILDAAFGVGDPDKPRVNDFSPSVRASDPELRARFFKAAAQGGYHLVFPRQYGGQINADAGKRYPEFPGAADCFQNLGGRLERFGGNAPTVQACAAQMTRLDQRYGTTQLSRPECGAVSAGAGAYDNNARLHVHSSYVA